MRLYASVVFCLVALLGVFRVCAGGKREVWEVQMMYVDRGCKELQTASVTFVEETECVPSPCGMGVSTQPTVVLCEEKHPDPKGVLQRNNHRYGNISLQHVL